uniref:methionine adenosyltransferase domain-containing protein n=1 Tax=Mycobacterium tuberculosis TaxID=1773 RepID=UPI001EEDD2F4
VGLFVETFGTETEDPVKIEKAIGEVFDLRPGAIIRDLNLLRPTTTVEAYWRSRRFDLGDYRISS